MSIEPHREAKLSVRTAGIAPDLSAGRFLRRFALTDVHDGTVAKHRNMRGSTCFGFVRRQLSGSRLRTLAPGDILTGGGGAATTLSGGEVVTILL